MSTTVRSAPLQIIVLLLCASEPHSFDRPRQPPGPIPINAANAPVGWIYAVETLEGLIARRPEATSPRIAEAVRNRTPIVVMWTIPPSPQFGPAPRPYRVSILDFAANEQAYGNPSWSEPVWILQNAEELARLDSGTEFQEVGAMAAFPLEAFAAGRKVVIHSDSQTADGKTVHHSRVGLFDWDPRRGDAKKSRRP